MNENNKIVDHVSYYYKKKIHFFFLLNSCLNNGKKKLKIIKIDYIERNRKVLTYFIILQVEWTKIEKLFVKLRQKKRKNYDSYEKMQKGEAKYNCSI